MAYARSRRSYQRPFQTKRGAHGTLYRFRIRYRDKYDPGYPESDWYTWAYNADHAEEKFWDSDADQDWKIVSGPERMRER